MTVWGSGEPYREFLHVDDCADACLFLMDSYDDEAIINMGTGRDIKIRDLSSMVGELIGFQGEIAFDTSKPDGTPRKLVDVSKLTELGWSSQIPLREGIASLYQWYRNHDGQ